MKLLWALIFCGLAFAYGLIEANNKGVMVISELVGMGLGYAALWFLIGLAVDFVVSFFIK